MRVLSLVLLVCVALLAATSDAAKFKNIRRTPTKLKCHQSSLSTCQCHNKKSVDCKTPDCLTQLPMSTLSSEDRKEIRFLRVKRQRNITSIDSNDLDELSNLEWIQFSSNKISSISPYAFSDQRNLVKLDLHNNQLKFIPEAIKYLPSLKKLNLGGNMIRSISRDAFSRNYQLETIILRKNMITQFPMYLPVNLIKLSLVQNQLREVGDATYLRNLQLLRLDGNQLTEIPNARYNISSTVSEITLCTNRLSSDSLNRDDALAGLENLRRLRLSGNPDIRRVTSDFLSGDGARQLRELELGLCEIDDITGDAFSCASQLQHVGLAGNKLKYYDDGWFAYNKRLRSLQLSNNEWHCTCEFIAQLKGLQAAVEARTQRLLDRDDMDKITLQLKNDFNTTICNTTTNELIEMDYGQSASDITAYWNSACVSGVESWKFQKRPKPSCFKKYQEDVKPETTTTTRRRFTTRPTTTRRRTTTTTRPTTRRTTTTTRPTTTTTRRTTTTTRPTTKRTTTTTRPTTTTTTPASHAEGVCAKSGACVWPQDYKGESYDGSKCIPSGGYWSYDFCYTDASASEWQYCGPDYC